MGQPSTEMFAAAFGVLSVFVGTVFAAPWLMRKVNRDLVKAQAIKTEAETDEILDRQAGVWIQRYEQRLSELDEFMDKLDEYHATHVAWDYIQVAALQKANIKTTEPPPLRPPRRARARRPHYDGHDLDRTFLESDNREGS